jgi:excisionase family DNA binding protein
LSRLGKAFLINFSQLPITDERSVVAEYLKLPEVAQRLDLSEKTVRRYVKAGVLPSVFIGNSYRVREEDLQEYLRRAKVEPGKAPRRSPFERSFNDVLGEEERQAGELLEVVETIDELPRGTMEDALGGGGFSRLCLELQEDGRIAVRGYRS